MNGKTSCEMLVVVDRGSEQHGGAFPAVRVRAHAAGTHDRGVRVRLRFSQPRPGDHTHTHARAQEQPQREYTLIYIRYLFIRNQYTNV